MEVGRKVCQIESANGEALMTRICADRQGIEKISDTIHPYPTYMLGNRQAADKWNLKRPDSPLLGLLGRMLGYRGVRKGSSAL